MAERIGIYREFVEAFAPRLAPSYPKMLDSLSEDPIANKEVIIEFLTKAGRIYNGTTAEAEDVFTGEPTGINGSSRTDGGYIWDMELAYCVDKYNLHLPEDFVEHILASR